MKIKFYQRIWFKLSVAFIGIILITLVSVFSGLRHTGLKVGQKYYQEHLQNRVDSMTGRLGERIESGVKPEDACLPLTDSMIIPGASVRILDKDGNELKRSDKGTGIEINLTQKQLSLVLNGRTIMEATDDRPLKRYNYIVSPIKRNEKVTGALMIVIPPQPREIQREYARALMHTILLAALISSLAAFFIARTFTRPINQIEIAAEEMASGDFSRKIDTRRNDELGKLAQSFNKMSEKLQNNIESRMRMAADISHELRTPLASIQGCTESILDDVVEKKEDREKYLKTILNQAKRLSILINDLTDLSRFEAGEISIEKKPFSTNTMVESVVQAASPFAKRKGIVLNEEIPEEDLQVTGDRDRIYQALTNLVNNAIQHNYPGVEVTVSAKRHYKEAMFSVRDNGPGIPREELPFIFERFHKVDRSRTRTHTGSGLGLAIVKAIVNAHGRTIDVKSSKRGTNFYFNLPLNK